MAGANGNPKFESFGNRNLWLFISGEGVLRPKDIIKRELTRHKDKILNGLLYYKKQRTPQGEVLKSKKIAKQQREFIEKLSIFLGLDEAQTYDLFCSYISQDFKGSQKNLQVALSTDRHTVALMVKIRDFFFTERLYLLQCVRQILTYWPESENHHYREEYAGFLNVLLTDNDLIKKLLGQLDLVCDEQLPNWESHGKHMSDQQALVWAHQNLEEQVELLETLLVYWKDFEVSVTDFTRLLEKFKRQGFGRRQHYKHKLDESSDRMLKRIGSLEVLVLLQALDLETVERLSHADNFSDHGLLKQKTMFETVDKAVQLLGTEQSHGPLLLSWATVRQLYLVDQGTNLTRKLGNTALQLNVFDFLSDLLDREPFSGKSMTASLSHCVVYTVLLAALTAFDESTLARGLNEMKVLYHITSKLLRREFIAGNVWTKGLDTGLGHMFKTALFNFPLDYTTLVQLSTSLASATSDSASKVLDLWSELPNYTEELDKNRSADIKPTQDSLVLQLTRDKLPYSTGDFRISAGVYGQLMPNNRKMRDDIPLIQWDVRYDGWQLLKCEILELLHQVSRGAGMVSSTQIARVTDVTEFVRAICQSQPGAADGLQDIISLLYTVIQRFSAFTPPPLDLLAASLECVTCVAKLYPQKAWHNMKQTGLLPFLTENIDNLAEVLSGQGLSPGLFGSLLAGYETAQGRYPVTLAYLDFLSELIQPLYKKNMEHELKPCVMYTLREIFPVFQKWRYYNSTRKEIIGQKCLAIAHRILNLRPKELKRNAGRPRLQQICMYSLLFTEAGRALLEVIATGVETIEVLLSQQSSQSEGSGEDLIQLVQIGFSVMNRLLQLRSNDEKISPVEVALSSQPVGYQNQHIVGVIAEYIYHRTNPLLPKLATLFLRRLAVVLPMSILACLGNQAEPIRDTYLMRLQSATEDLSLKTGILELLSVCVDTQPGLIEKFLNVQPSDNKTDKDLDSSGTSCIQTVLDLMEGRKQGSYQCPPDLLAACTHFIQALWVGMRETAMAALRAKPSFWSSLCQPLFKDLPDPSEDQLHHFKVKTVSYILKVLAQEIYSNHSKLDDNLKVQLKELAEKGRLKYWSRFITACMKDADSPTLDQSHDHSGDPMDHPTNKLLLAWKNILVVLAKMNVLELKLDDGLKEVIILDLLGAIHAQFTDQLTELRHKMSQTCSALFFTLVKSWTGSVKSWSQLLQQTHDCLSLTLTCGDAVIPSVQIGLLGAITTMLQYQRLETSKRVEMKVLRPLLSSMCEVLLQSTRELPAPGVLKSLRGQQEGPEKGFSGTDHRLKLQIMACCLLEELIHHIKEPEIWLPILQENAILTALLSSAQTYLKAQEGLHYMQSLFILFLTLSKIDKGAEALSVAGLTQHVCLPATCCYQNGDSQLPTKASTQKQTTSGSSSHVTWQGIFCLILELYTSMLETLKFSFLEDGLNFVGCHQDRLHQGLEVARYGLHPESFLEVEKTCMFVCQLSHYSREWRLHLPDSLNKILTSIIYTCQTFVAYLIRPRYLQHVLEHQGVERSGVKRDHERLLLPSLHHQTSQTSTEELDNLSLQNVQVQHSMMKALGQSFVALRQFSPDLVLILMDQNLDIGEYEPFLIIGFSAPPVDQDTPPTYGTLLTCVNVCLRLLSKIEPRSMSPQKSDSTSTVSDSNLAQCMPKNQVMFVAENALYLIMSQAMLYLKDPRVPPREKQLLKRELATEMNSILSGIHRYFRRGGPQSPATQPSSRSQSPGGPTLVRSISQTFVSNEEQAIFRLVQEFSRQVLR